MVRVNAARGVANDVRKAASSRAGAAAGVPARVDPRTFEP